MPRNTLILKDLMDFTKKTKLQLKSETVIVFRRSRYI